MSRPAFALAAVLLCTSIGLGAAQPGATTLTLPDPSSAKVSDYPGLHNVVAYAPGVYSGSLPEGQEGFASLKALGIKTILSVDGATPDVQSAEALGMRYVHLPITYSGMTDERKTEIARAVRDLPHPMYIHCHHGKHRSAAATGAAAVSLGWLSPDQAQERMKVSGTAPSYKGLWKCVALSAVIPAETLDKADNSFPTSFIPTDMVHGMVDADHAFDNLKALEANGWTTPKDHPDLVPAAEAGRIADSFRFLATADAIKKSEPTELIAWLDKASSQASALEEAIVANKPAAELSQLFKVVGQSCKDCHVKYRD